MRGTGTGAFLAPTTILAGAYGDAIAVAAGDFNGDGYLDIVVAYAGPSYPLPGGVLVLPGDGAGRFSQAIRSAGGSQYLIAVADFDGDGRLDLAVGGSPPGSSGVRFGNGDGTFGAVAPLPVDSPQSILVADFDGDGKPDISMADSNSAHVFLHAGPRTFDSGRVLRGDGVYFDPTQFVADLDGDGRPDLLVNGYVHLNRGGGRFELPFGSIERYETGPVGGAPPVVADFDGDGRPDLVVFDSNGLHLYRGRGDGTFGAGTTIPMQSGGRMIALDANEDGALDLVGGFGYSNGGIATILGRGDGTFLFPASIPGSGRPVGRADFTGDGIPDLVFIEYGGLKIVPGLPGGGFGPPRIDASISGSLFPTVIGDFNGDGRADIAIATNPGILIRLGLAGGGLGPPTTLSVSGFVSDLAAGDFNGDGRDDLAYIHDQALGISFAAFDGSFPSGYDPPGIFGGNDGVRVADMNGDGKADLVIFGRYQGLRVFVGDGGGQFTLQGSRSVDVSSILLVDVDGDSRPDIVATGFGLRLFRNDGTGAINGPYEAGPFPPADSYSVASGDFNQDGKIDLAAFEGGRLVILNGNGAGQFAESGTYPGLFSLLAADLDGDGKTDLVGGAGTPGTYWILRNTNCEPRRAAMVTAIGSCDSTGVPFSPQPSIRITDDGGNPILCAAGTVTASLVSGTGPAGAVLEGTRTVPVAGGIAPFTNLALDGPGSGFRIDFTHSSGARVRSRSLSVSPPAPTIAVTGACAVGQARLETAGGYDSYRWSVDGMVVSTLAVATVDGLSVGPHSLLLETARDGCATSASQALTIAAAPAAPAASSNGPVPFGQTLQLFATTVPGATYEWTGPNGFSSTTQNPAIPGATPAASGTYGVVARAGGCTSAEATVSVRVLPASACGPCSHASFGSVPRLISSPAPLRIAPADFNGDGVLDLAVSAANGAGIIQVFPGLGRGEFGPPIETSVNAELAALVATDLDRDGAVDLVYIANGRVRYRRGLGNAQFGAESGPSIVGAAIDLAVGDWNGDGLPDLAVATITPNALSILLSDGSGGFTTSVSLPLPGTPVAIASGILRAGSRRDLAVALGTPDGNGEIRIFLGAGDGGFSIGPSVPGFGSPVSLTLGDLDGDGKTDLAAAFGGMQPPQRLAFFAGQGDGTFLLRSLLPIQVTSKLRIADIDGDGFADAVFFDASGRLNLLPGKGGWKFGAVRPSFASDGFRDFEIADFDGDGHPDAAVSNYPFSDGVVAIVRGGIDGFDAPETRPVGRFPTQLGKGDFNGDGHLDVVALSSDPPSPSIGILFNDGFGNLGERVPVPGTDSAGAFAAADLNGDGRTDLLILKFGDILVYLGAAEGPPVLRQTLSGLSAVSLAVADFNGDGKKDLVYVANDSVFLRLGNGAGDFGAPTTLTGFARPALVFVGDFNGDGKADLFSGTSVAFGAGDGTFGTPFALTSAGRSPVVGDLDGDGRDDIVSLDQYGAVVASFSTGTGFLPPVTVSDSYRPSGLAVIDVNGDGRGDIVGWSTFSNEITVFPSAGRTFPSSVQYPAGRGPDSVLSADLDEDGRPELLVSSLYDGSITIFHNTRCVPRRLGLSTQVSRCDAPSAPFAVQPVVSVYDDGDNVVACASSDGNVTASIAARTGPPGAILGGATSVSAASGVAAFSNLSIDLAGSYALEFHHPTAAPARTVTFDVGPALNPSIAGVALVCGAPTAQYDAGAGYDTYSWSLDGAPILPRQRTVTIGPLGPGPHMLLVRVTRGACQAQTSRSIANAPPSITGISPASGPAAGGTRITVSGSCFVSGASLALGGTAAVGTTFVTSSILTATAPGHAAGAVTAAVTNPDGQTGSLSAAFDYICLPPVATVTGGPVRICPGTAARLQVVVTGGAPGQLHWSDGFVQDYAAAGVVERLVSPSVTTAYSITSVTSSFCPGSASGSADVTVESCPAGVAAGSSIADGRPVSGMMTASGSSYDVSVTGGRNYVVELDVPAAGASTLAGGGPSPTLDVVRGGAPLLAPPESWIGCAPAGSVRLFFHVAEASGSVEVRVHDPVSSGYGFRLSVVETTLFAPRWSVNGYLALVDLQNTTDCVVTGTVWINASDGSSARAPIPFTLPPGGSVQTPIAGTSVSFGSLVVEHDGAASAVVGGVYMASPAGANFRWQLQGARAAGAAGAR